MKHQLQYGAPGGKSDDTMLRSEYEVNEEISMESKRNLNPKARYKSELITERSNILENKDWDTRPHSQSMGQCCKSLCDL